MGVLNQSFDALDNLKLYEDGAEVDIKIKSVKHAATKKDPSKSGITVTFEVMDDENVSDSIFWWTECPVQEGENFVNNLRRLKHFFEAFGIDTDEGIELDDLKGLTGSALLGVEDSDEYGERNVIKRFVTGH